MNSMHEIKMKNFKPTADIIQRYYNGRQIVLLGDSIMLRELLERDYGIKATLIATHVKEKVGKHGLIDIDTFKDHSSEYYIVVPFIKSEPNIKKRLISMGYLEFKDFVFTMHEKIVLKAGFGSYHDEYGNHIHCNGCQVSLRENVGNTTIMIDDSVSFGKSCAISVASPNCTVNIKKGCQTGNNFKIILWSSSEITIDEGCTFGHNDELVVHHGNKIEIGKDNMFSHDIKIYAGDGHSVFDTDTGNRRNPPPEDKSDAVVEIKDHVWVGVRSIILGGKKTVIGQSDIIGAGAVVKGVFPNNCAIAGNPAKVVRKNITWSRNNLAEDISDCGEENINPTNES